MTDSAIGAPVDEYVVGKNDKLVILASSVGTVIEWYDFYLYGSLAAIITVQFFSGVNETTGYIFALMAFAAGFAVRPFGAVVFGRLGDLCAQRQLAPDQAARRGQQVRHAQRQAIVVAFCAALGMPALGQHGDALIGQAQALVGRVLAHQADPACREEVDVDGVAAGPSGRSPDFHEAREVRPCGLEVHGKHPAVCGLSLIRQWTSGMLLRHTVCPSSILHQFPPCPRPSPS